MKVPEGFEQVKGAKRKFGAPVFRKGNVYISPDKTAHNTIEWKVAKGKPKNLLKKEIHEGTFNESLTK